MPQGGTITPASMLPMILFAVVFGPVAGMIAGVGYGLLQLIQDPYVVHWAQLLLDYPLAFGAIGMAGLSRNNIPVAVLIGGFGRFLMHFISGFVFFGSYAPPGSNVIMYSLVYNGVSIGVEVGICLVVSFLPVISTALNRIRKEMIV